MMCGHSKATVKWKESVGYDGVPRTVANQKFTYTHEEWHYAWNYTLVTALPPSSPKTAMDIQWNSQSRIMADWVKYDLHAEQPKRRRVSMDKSPSRSKSVRPRLTPKRKSQEKPRVLVHEKPDIVHMAQGLTDVEFHDTEDEDEDDTPDWFRRCMSMPNPQPQSRKRKSAHAFKREVSLVPQTKPSEHGCSLNCTCEESNLYTIEEGDCGML